MFSKRIKYICMILYFFSNTTLVVANPLFHAFIKPIPPTVAKQMQRYTWRPGCPVPLSDLRYVEVSYWGFDNKTHSGVLIVNSVLAQQVRTIFQSLYVHRFPIKRMQPMYLFKGDDEKSMEHNNTSSFNCRPVAGRHAGFSQHAYGTAIDINTLINPYIKGQVLLPKNARQYLNRTNLVKVMITKNTYIYKLFIRDGWQWGGNWHSLKDYQHFQKPLPEYKKKI